MSASNIDFVKAMYDERSEHYDDSKFHVLLAQEYIQLATPKDGEKVLDLACGTGLVTLLAKKEVGERGRVVGVDVSDGMLRVAQRKSKEAGLVIDFINHDITDLHGLKLLPEGSKGFDLITCASALVLIKNPLQAIKNWTSMLAPGGRLIIDLPVQGSSIPIDIMTEIGPELGHPLNWDQSWVKSGESLRTLLTEAGLVVERILMTGPYEAQDYAVDSGPELFEKAIAGPMMRDFGEDGIRDRAKARFVEKFKEMAGENGAVHCEVKYYFGIARKEI